MVNERLRKRLWLPVKDKEKGAEFRMFESLCQFGDGLPLRGGATDIVSFSERASGARQHKALPSSGVQEALRNEGSCREVAAVSGATWGIRHAGDRGISLGQAGVDLGLCVEH